MPTREAYKEVFYAIVDEIMSRPADTKAQCRHLAALANKAIRAKRDEFTREITNRWRGEFARIKVENDEWQKALNGAYKDWLQMIDERLSDMFEGIQG